MRRVIAQFGLLAIAFVSFSGVPLVEDAPTAGPPKSGDLTGTITTPKNVTIKKLSAVSRVSGKTYTPKSFDAKTGKFVFKNLPGDARYDLVIRTSDGRDIEGIDLDFVDARLLRLAELRRKQLGLKPEPHRPFTQEDAGALIKFAASLEEFSDDRRVLYIQGHGKRATMLVEQLRTREFYGSDTQYVWRIDLWYFENQYGGWARVPNEDRTLRRRRLSPEQWKKIDVTYYPQLSGVIDADGRNKPITFTLPAMSDASRGRSANTAVDLKTKPHVLGLDTATTDSPTSQPANN